jgi:hypothetical protein
LFLRLGFLAVIFSHVGFGHEVSLKALLAQFGFMFLSLLSLWDVLNLWIILRVWDILMDSNFLFYSAIARLELIFRPLLLLLSFFFFVAGLA